MRTEKVLTPAAALLCLALFSGCGGQEGEHTAGEDAAAKYKPADARPIEGSFTAHIDADRAVDVRLDGAYKVESDVSDAPAGKADIFIQTGGLLYYTGSSEKGRETDSFDVVLELVVPIAGCPWLEQEIPFKYCAIPLGELAVGSTEPGSESDYVIKEYEQLGTVAEGKVDAVIELIEKQAIVVVIDDSLRVSPQKAINPTCKINQVRRITYFSEDPSVNGCTFYNAR